MKNAISKAAAALGKKGGASKSAAKKAASKENGKLGGRPRRIVACANCGAKAKIGWITAMEKAGFGVRHLACKECGQSALKED
jgi:RecJ-like exonuclease